MQEAHANLHLQVSLGLFTVKVMVNVAGRAT